MPIYEFGNDSIERLHESTFSNIGIQERRDLQRMLRDNIDVLCADSLVLSEEFGEWEESRRRIDLLAINKAANLVVIELKRTEDGGHMELQSIRYAAMVSNMTFDQAVETFTAHLNRLGEDGQDARDRMLKFLDWPLPDETRFAQDVEIVLASANFSKELTSSVLWLNKHDLNIRCVRMKPYSFDGRLLVDVQQIIPLPEAEEYQVQVRDKARKEREASQGGADWTRFDVVLGDTPHSAVWKRDAMFLVCKYLCENGVSPEEISSALDMRIWFTVNGSVGATAFRESATQEAIAAGGKFDERRWFCNDGDLVHSSGKTYALSNQWGGESWRKAMDALISHFEAFNISYAPSS